VRWWPDADPAADAGGALWGPPPEFSEPPAGAADALRDLWREIDEAVAERGVSCRACGRCCDFPRAGHVLFAAKIELDVCLAWAAAHRVTDARAARSLLARGRCPFHRGGLCAVRPVRPLGCRVYFCDVRWADEVASVGESSRRGLGELSRRYGVEWWYGPALAWLSRNLPLLIRAS